MAEEKKTAQDEAPNHGPPAELPPALRAKVKRTVVEKGKDGKPVERRVAIKAREVLSWRDYGDRVVVVTTDGKKFTSEE